MPYAERTKVPVIRSQQEIERVLSNAGARQFCCGHDRDEAWSFIQFSLEGRMMQIRVPIPEDEREERRRWRVLLITIKAKLEWLSLGFATVDEVFLADIYLPSGETVGQWLLPQIEQAYIGAGMPKLLGSGS